MLPAIYLEYYVKISSKLEDEFEWEPVLTVQTLPFFIYYSDTTLADDGSALEIWHITITEYIALAVLLFLVASCDDAMSVVCLDLRIGGNACDVLVHLPTRVPYKVDDFGFPNIMCTWNLESVPFLVAYHRLSETNWAWIELP